MLKTFESEIFSGAKLETDADNIDTLLALPEVVAAWPNRKVHLLAPINARQVAINQSEADTYAVHWATGVESLHEQGMLGEGTKVGIIDTGTLTRLWAAALARVLKSQADTTLSVMIG